MKVKAIQYYSDTELQRNINVDEVFEVTPERASYLADKGFVKIIIEVEYTHTFEGVAKLKQTPIKKAKAKK